MLTQLLSIVKLWWLGHRTCNQEVTPLIWDIPRPFHFQVKTLDSTVPVILHYVSVTKQYNLIHRLKSDDALQLGRNSKSGVAQADRPYMAMHRPRLVAVLIYGLNKLSGLRKEVTGEHHAVRWSTAPLLCYWKPGLKFSTPTVGIYR